MVNETKSDLMSHFSIANSCAPEGGMGISWGSSGIFHWINMGEPPEMNRTVTSDTPEKMK